MCDDGTSDVGGERVGAAPSAGVQGVSEEALWWCTAPPNRFVGFHPQTGHSHPLPCEYGGFVGFEASVPEGDRGGSDGEAALGRDEGDGKESVGGLAFVEARVVLVDGALVQEGGSEGGSSLP